MLKRRSRSVLCGIMSTPRSSPIGFYCQAPCVVISFCGGRRRRAQAGWWWPLVSHVVDRLEAYLTKCVWYRVQTVCPSGSADKHRVWWCAGVVVVVVWC